MALFNGCRDNGFSLSFCLYVTIFINLMSTLQKVAYLVLFDLALAQITMPLLIITASASSLSLLFC